jgi:exosortase
MNTNIKKLPRSPVPAPVTEPASAAASPRTGLGTAVAWIVLVVGLAVIVWAYWPAYLDLSHEWDNPQYSHGYLVPFFALGLLWLRRQHVASIRMDLYRWGLPVLALAALLRFAENFRVGIEGVDQIFAGVEWFDNVSLLVFLTGLTLLVSGWPGLRWAGPSILFLLFMIPMPYRLSEQFAWELQRLGTIASTYVIQTIGLPAVADGNRIIINRGEELSETVLGVAEACSGLRMLLVFFALSTAVAFLMRGTWWERVLVFLSAVPIALIANITRISVTGVLYVYADEKLAHDVFHDWAGWLMMPFALALLWIELKIFGRLFVEARQRRPKLMPLLGARPPLKKA